MNHELDARRELQARWRKVVRAVGLDDKKHTPEETYFLAAAIMNDRVVDQLVMRAEFQIRDEEFPCSFVTDWPKLGAALGPAGRAALAERLRSK
jgi:hypothetical protein